MTADTAPLARPGARVPPTSCYYSFLLVVFVVCTMTALTILTPRSAYLSVMETGEGDLGRQVGYVIILVAAVLPIALRHPARLATMLPLSLLALLAWCGATLLWSPVPDIALRRYGLTAVLSVTAIAIASQLSIESGLQVIGKVLVGLVAASLIAAILMPHVAFHQPGDAEVGTVGSLRGIFYHKNIFGTVAALAVLFVWNDCLATSRSQLKNWIALIMCIVALVLSESKTAAILTATVGLLMWTSAVVLKNRAADPATAIGIGLLIVALLLPLSLYLPDLVDQPELFTGRGLIWQLTYRLALEDPLFGSGFQSIFQVGSRSAMREMYSSTFVQTLSHAHNAYLELFASIGLVGLVLATLAVVAAPMRNLSQLEIRRPTRSLVLSVTLFAACHALLESGLVDRDRPTWIMMLLVIGLVAAALRQQRPAATVA